MVKGFGNALAALKEGLEAYEEIEVGADELQASDRADRRGAERPRRI